MMHVCIYKEYEHGRISCHELPMVSSAVSEHVIELDWALFSCRMRAIAMPCAVRYIFVRLLLSFNSFSSLPVEF